MADVDCRVGAGFAGLTAALHQMASGGGPGFVFGIKGASQDSRPVGGVGAIYHKVATELGGAVHLNQPVRRTGRGPRAPRSCADGSTGRSAPVSGRRPR